MFLTLVKKEARALLQSHRYLVYMVMSFLIITTSVMLLGRVYNKKLVNHRGLAEQFVQDAKKIDEGGKLYTPTRDGVHYSIKPSPLQIFCQGVQRDFSQMLRVSLNIHLPLLKSGTVWYPFHAFFIPVDLTTIVIFLLSLMVFLFSYDTVSGERESGTLRLVLSSAVPRAQIIGAKLVAGYGGVVIPLVISCLSSLLLLRVVNGIILTSTQTLAVLLLFAGACLYLLVMFLMGMLVSVRCRRSVHAISILVISWLLLVVVLHNVTLLALNGGREAVNKAELKRQQYDHYMVMRTESKKWEKEIKAKKGELTKEDKDRNFIRWIEGNTRYGLRLVNEYVAYLEKARRTVRVSTWFSPTLQFLSLATSLTGTGLESRIDLYRAVTAHEESFLTYIKMRMDEGKEKTVVNLAAFPALRVPAPDPAAAIRDNTGYLALQVILCLLLFAGTVHGFITMKDV